MPAEGNGGRMLAGRRGGSKGIPRPESDPEEGAHEGLEADRPAENGGGPGPQCCPDGVASGKGIEQHDAQPGAMGGEHLQPGPVCRAGPAGVPDHEIRIVIESRPAADAAGDPESRGGQQVGNVLIEVGPDQTREARVLVSTHGAGGAKGQQAPLVFTATDASTGEAVAVKDVFIWP